MSDVPRRAYSPAEVGAMVGLSVVTVQRAMARGDLSFVQIGSRRRISVSQVDEWLAKNTREVA